MKNIYVIILALFFSFSLSAEEFLNEPFSTWLPDGWSVIDGPGTIYYSHWFHREDQFATVYVTGDNQDEWLITPEITLPAEGELKLSADMMGAPYRMITMDWGDFFVNVSTDNGATWETIWVEDDQEIVEASGVAWPWQHNTWFFPSISLNDFAGESIIIGFRYVSPDGDADWWNLDNVIVKSLTENEVVLQKFEFPEYALVDDEFSFEGEFRNLGENEVTSFEAIYTVDGVDSDPYLIDNVNIPYNSTYDFTHNIPYQFTNAEIYELSLRIDKVNGTDDPIPGNNVLYRDISIASGVVSRRPLFEMFTSSTCAPCVQGNEALDGVLNANPEDSYSLVKYQVDWPGIGDPYYIEACGVRVDYYNIGGVPHLITNGRDLGSGSFTQSQFNQATDEVAYASVELDYTFDGLNVEGFLTIDPKINIADARVHFSVVEKTTYNNVGSNGETEFHNVLMAMIPDAEGTSIVISEGVIATYSATANLITTFIEEYDDLKLVAWVQDNLTQSVLQSTSIDLEINTGVQAQKENQIIVYPNPGNGIFTIQGVENSKIEVSNIKGQLIFRDSGFENVRSIDLSGFENGIYFLRILSDGYNQKPIKLIKK